MKIRKLTLPVASLCLFLNFIISLSLQSYEVISLGGIVIDQTSFVSDEYIEEVVKGAKGGSALVSHEAFSTLLQDFPSDAGMTPGGSGVNTLKGLASLGHSCCLLGKVSDDFKGYFFLDSLIRKGIQTQLVQVPHPSAQCICLITPDKERTMRTFLGPTHDFSDLPLDPNAFEGVSLTHVLTGLEPEEACTKLSEYCNVAVVTMGSRGGWVQRGTEKVRFEAYPAQVLDTTGAGDLFISGFLHGYLIGMPLEKCAWLGALVSAKVVQVIGAELPDDGWREIHEIIDVDFNFFTASEYAEKGKDKSLLSLPLCTL